VLGCTNTNLVEMELIPLQARLDLFDAELRTIVLKHPAVLGYDHRRVVVEKLNPLQARAIKSATAEGHRPEAMQPPPPRGGCWSALARADRAQKKKERRPYARSCSSNHAW
jgi:hypothetical protein